MAEDDLQKPEDLAKMEKCEQFRQDIQTIIIRLVDHLPQPDSTHSNANTNTIHLRILGLRQIVSSRMDWFLWTGVMWATPSNITPKSLMGMRGEFHQHGISRMTAPSTHIPYLPFHHTMGCRKRECDAYSYSRGVYPQPS
jgi:hypothetical protein